MAASLLIRTWNIAHGRDIPPGAEHGHLRRKLLREMAAVMTQDDPDVVLLQEVPVWAADLLREHTGMSVTLAPTYGAHIPFVHVPLPLAARRRRRPGAARPRPHAGRGPGAGHPVRRRRCCSCRPAACS